VAQRFQWPGIPANKGFIITAYPDRELAENHLQQLTAGDGKVLDVQVETDKGKLKNLCKADSGYAFFYSATKDKDARKQLVKAYEAKITAYSKACRHGKFEFGIKVAAGQLYGIYSYENQTVDVLFYDIIK